MYNKLRKWIINPRAGLLFFFLPIISYHIYQETNLSDLLAPESVYQFNLNIFFDADGDVDVATYLPLENSRQQILDESIVAKSLEFQDITHSDGRYVKWTGGEQATNISYKSILTLRKVQFDISTNIEIPEKYNEDLSAYLQSTEAVQVQHDEIKVLWQKIKPNDEGNLYQVLNSIYLYTYKNIKNMPFKGLTDSLTALRLEAASCNGKSRLFISLARLNNLPSRLVGGVILNGKKKKTSHQWVEVFIRGHWVPFDTTNGHFAVLPENYLELYRGDHNLFRHTSNINFDYHFNSSKERISPTLYRSPDTTSSIIPNSARTLQALGLSLKSSYIFLLLPFCTLVIAFLRNVVGLKTFGIFMPMLVAAACVYTGILLGLVAFILILLLAVSGHMILGKFHILKIPRLAAIITLISITSLIGISFVGTPIGVESSMLALFPSVIISFTADRLSDMSNEHNWSDMLKNALGTLVTILLCYTAFQSILLQGLFALFPELLLLVLAILMYIGSWTGIRVSEVIRFRSILDKQGYRILGLNERNRELIYKENDKALLLLAADKLRTKEILKNEGVPCPETWSVCRSYAEIDSFLSVILNKQNFVIKPNNGSRGNGIIVIAQHNHDGFITTSGKALTNAAIRQHISEILSGSFSQSGQADVVYIEPIIRQHEFLQSIADRGLSDIRIILRDGQVLSAMLRAPTIKSDGKSNLHQGAIGVSVNIKTGELIRAAVNGREITTHPDSNLKFDGIYVPFWDQIKEMSTKCYNAIPLGYMGVDVCIDTDRGPLILEVNGRPGLEIQNVQNSGLLPVINEKREVICEK
ncbi:MAG: hypothetical protein JKY01_02195 [Pseudomonadales bacterium]|nr:hypothetical protein [Pseudomonadales bacterium]